MADKKKSTGPLPWYKEDTHFFQSDEVAEIWDSEGRNQHKVLLLLFVIKGYITFTLRGEKPVKNQEYFLNLNKLATLSHLNKTTIKNYLKELSIFGIEVLQVCNKSVTIRYDNYRELQDLGRQIREDKIRQDKITQDEIREDNNASSTAVNITASSSSYSPLRGSENKVPKLKEKDLTEDQRSVLFKEGRWSKKKSFNIISSLKYYFDGYSEEQIADKVHSLTERLVNLDEATYSKGEPYGYLFLYNSINKFYKPPKDTRSI